MEWLNAPAQWTIEDGTISVTSDAKTDFWRTTHYGFVRDNGHFLYQRVAGNFRCEVGIRGAYQAQYDQAGLMLRQDATTWVKSGIEYVDGVQHVSAVVTRDFSDWSVTPLPVNPPAIWFQFHRQGDALEIRYALEPGQWTLLRLAYVPPGPSLDVGVMCASPDGDGFAVTFTDFTLTQID